VGVIAIRVLAGGALSGTEARHPVAAREVEPIASGPSYAADVVQARRLRPLVEAGHAADLVEAALRFAIVPQAVSTALVGTSSLAELEHAVAAVRKGPLSAQALRLLDTLPRS
jgi:aryl-alcohol dehydrogenase-like predicted oxidoreductase